MGREKGEQTKNERQRATRAIRVAKSANKTFCNVCNIFVECNSNASLALTAHAKSSRRHKDLLRLRDPNRENDEIEVFKAAESDIDLDDEEIHSDSLMGSPSRQGVIMDVDIYSSNVDTVAESYVVATGSDVESCIDGFEVEEDEGSVDATPLPPDSRDFLLLTSSLPHGRKTMYQLTESPILNLQELLLEGFDRIIEGKSPYPFSKIKKRDVDWITSLEITRDYLDSNESIALGDRRIRTTRNALRRETGISSRVPKRMSTLLNGFCQDVEQSSKIVEWKSGFFDEYLNAAKKKEMKANGIRWRPLKGHFIPLESALAQLLLRLKVEDFDCNVGPCYRDCKERAIRRD